MANPHQLPYGTWPSPIDAAALVSGATTPTDAWAEGGTTWWSQTRPDQGGRIQVVRRDPDGSLHDVLPDGWNARTRAHEYGGGAWWVHDGAVFVTAWDDQRLYRIDPGRSPVALTPKPPVPQGFRYADGRLTPDASTVVCVREDHTSSGPGAEVRNEIIALPACPGGGDPTPPVVLVSSHDFVAAPRVSPDGSQLAWLSWEHPDMPWDATALWVANLVVNGASYRLEQIRQVAGTARRSPGESPAESGIAEESLVQPEWSMSGELFVVSDRSNWWNVYRVDALDAPGDQPPTLVAVHPIEAEVARPAWLFGQSRYAVGADGTVWFTHSAADGAHLIRVRRDGAFQDDVLPFVSISALRLDGDRLVAVATSQAAEAAVVELTVDVLSTSGPAGGKTQPAACPDHREPEISVLRAPRDLAEEFGIVAGSISRPRRICFPCGDRTAHAWFYLPANAGMEAPAHDCPPLIVSVHGGPTAAADPSFRIDVQFWTTRGFAVADVDYGGSTGYGRAYRRLLDGAWGIVDVSDVGAAALWLAGEGLVDGERMAIRGGSAGGYTTLMAMAVTDVFAAGASHFGVTDLAALARDTHKFEARYLDRLVGPWPQAEDVYAERSPIQHVDGFNRPLIVFQGDEDAVVPPAQSELIVSALAARRIPHAYLLFAGEQHGFRRAESIVAAVQAELSFYGQVFGFTPAGNVPPVPVEFADKLHSGNQLQPDTQPHLDNRSDG
jgi:dipeptidyl aminopeptidase/acylaminoacyl peptidase